MDACLRVTAPTALCPRKRRKRLGSVMLLVYLLVLTGRMGQCTTSLTEEGKILRLPGDVIFGGMFPMHEHVSFNVQQPCGAVKEEKGTQRLEAMLYALDEINRDPDILPNVTLGAVILDTCSSDTYALEQAMEFVRSYMNQRKRQTAGLDSRGSSSQTSPGAFEAPPTTNAQHPHPDTAQYSMDVSEYKCESGKPPLYVPHKPVSGVIGASFSGVSIMVANILRLFKIPQISYASTSTELSDKSRFEYFSRVVPPDNFQAQAMVEIVKKFGWKYVSTVAVEGEYGEKGITSFTELAAKAGICIAAAEKILRNSKPEDFDRIVEKLVHKPGARAVIMFVDEDNIRKLLRATILANRTGHFYWIGSDSWGAKLHPVREQEWSAEGAITILPSRTALKGFDQYFKSLRPRLSGDRNICTSTIFNEIPDHDDSIRINCRNVWFREFWSQHFKCTFNGSENSSLSMCSGKEQISEYEQEGLVPFVVDAVYAMAHAIHNLMADFCGTDPFQQCDRVVPSPPGRDLLRYIRNVSFIGRQGTEVRFNKDGDAYGRYTIYQYQKKDDRYDYVLIGGWSERLDLNISQTKWREENGTLPKSICSEACPLGHIRNFQDQCCWMCVSCREDAYVFNDTCVACAPGYAPSDDKVNCTKLAAEYIVWDSPWALVPLAFASFGILCTIFTFTVFIRYNNTPVIMASGRELCYLLLLGILTCYLMSFVVLAKPTIVTCTFLRIGLGLCLSLCYSAIFTKTNRISRIFNRGVMSIKRPSYTSPRSQVFICLGIVAVQVIGAIAWLAIEKPTTKEIYPYPLVAILTCGISTFSLMMSLVYNMILILLCTLYAFKTRKIPENFNEAKYIGFTMYSTCIVWLAFVPIYFGTNNDYKIQIASMCVCISISATVALVCLFTPKVYIVLFQPFKNVRQGTGQNPSGGYRVGHSMRFGRCHSQTVQSVQSMTSCSRSSPKAPHKQVNGDPATLTSPSIEESSIS